MSNQGFQFDFTPHLHLISQYKIGVTTSIWNFPITSALKSGCLETLKGLGVKSECMVVLDVPGAFELPLAAEKLFNENQCDAVICLGCVIKGDTPHFDYVCEGATQGIMRVILDKKKPVVFGLITTLNEQQAWDRTGGSHGHKGKEAAETVIQQLIAFEKL